MKQISNWFIGLDNSNKVALIIALLGMGGGVFAYFDSSAKKDTTSQKEESVAIQQKIEGDNGIQIGNSDGNITIGNSSDPESKE